MFYNLSISEGEQKIKEIPISSKSIFGSMALGAYTDVILPMIVKTLEIDGYISIADESSVELTEKGKIRVKDLLGIK